MKKPFKLPKTGKKRFILAVGSLIGVAVLATSAAFTDNAYVNLGGSGGLGDASKFDIALLDSANGNRIIQSKAPGAILNHPITNADKMVPGSIVSTVINVVNNSKNADSTLKVTIDAPNGGQVGSAPNITQFLRFTATYKLDGAGAAQPLFSDVTLAQANATLGGTNPVRLKARGVDSQADGAVYAAAAANGRAEITLTIEYREAAGTEAYNGGQSALQMIFDGTTIS